MTARHRRGLRVTILAMVASIIHGCAAGISTHVLEPRPPVPESAPLVLAVMPGAAESGSGWISSEMAARVSDALGRTFPGVVIVSPEEAAVRLVAHHMVSEYAAAVEQFNRVGLIEPTTIRRIALALEATNFLWLRSSYDAENELDAATNLDGSPLFYSAKCQRLSTSATLWSFSEAMPVWEAVVRSESRAGLFSRNRQPVELLDAVVHELSRRFPIRSPRR